MERYESLGLVGEGSYGTVLKCRHRDSGRLVAIKKFVDSDDDKAVKKIALREIKLLRQLRHDNLVNLLEVWKRRRRWYLVFEFVERTLLDDLEQNPSGLDLNTSRQYLYQILRAAAFCHQQNIIHRDIKPENILISQGGVVKMCDFGFARTMASPAEGGVYTDYVATRWYRAPELLVGDTKPVDVWAVGCLLLEMLTGQPLFPGDSDLDQIYHIVRCFGNLTAHHQELFYRNPVFSGVRLPEYSCRVRLEQRFPVIAPAALDLAQSCLEMDPERRAQCSELQEHPLFTQDSFHIRFLDELNAKIQKDHRENSTLPKITKTARRERNEGDDKRQRSKDKKPSEGVDEKVNKETKGKQTLKFSKTIRNTSEPLMSTKQVKTLGAKMINNAAKTTVAMKGKPGKATGAELRKEPQLFKSTKTLTFDSLEVAKTATDLKDNDTVADEPKVASPEPRQGHLKTMDSKDRDSSGMHSSYSDYIVSSVTERNVMGIRKSSKSEPSQDFGKNHSNSKVPNLSKSSHSNESLSPKASMKSTIDRTDTHLTQKMGKMSTSEYLEGASTAVTSKLANSDQLETKLTCKASQPSSNDHIEVTTTTIPSVTKPCKTTSVHRSTMKTDQRGTPECPKVLPSNPRPLKTNSNFGPKMTQNHASLSNSPSDLSTQSSTVFREASPAHSTITLPKGTSNTMLSKTGSSLHTKPSNDSTFVPNKPPRGLPTDRELAEVYIATKTQQDSCNALNKDLTEDHGCLKMSPVTKTAANHSEISDASAGDYKGSPEFLEPSSVHQDFGTVKSKITFRTTSTSMPNDIPKINTTGGAAILKTLKVSDKENREDLALPVSVSAITKSLVNQPSKVSRNSNIEQKSNSNQVEPDTKSMKPPHFKSLIGDAKKPTKSNATMTLKKTNCPTEARKKRDNPERDDTTNISTIADSTSFTSTATPDPKASTRSSLFHNRGTADVDEFDFSIDPSSPPPPPPPPSSTPLLLPPSSTPIIPSFCAVSPAASDHLSLGAGFHSGVHSFRCVDHPRHHSGVYGRLSSHATGALTAQVSEKNPTCERPFLSDRCNLGNSGGVAATKKKSDVHFPDLRSSVLPEVRGREGKHNKGTSKDQRKDKLPAPPSEPEQHGRNSTDTQTP
ncbi:probable serine/threonine-protein kinase MARK-A isoform X2 [Cyclopterus lumpus]|uniref:probable serine/threonine-protein kinase MARK-A isoform X2 n=1 Tax=Cyclopterus lumpus TaxID=8103 RepID=UPI0014869047|nr:probable serine/threonine-protein kinase MARK-A isoform X2 [Cyclopterus lumpus]